MVISKEVSLPALLWDMIEHNLEEEADPKYIHFLCNVQLEAIKDKAFCDSLETLLHYYGGAFPSITKVELTLAKMEGGIRPLLEDRGIVEPRPKVGGVI